MYLLNKHTVYHSLLLRTLILGNEFALLRYCYIISYKSYISSDLQFIPE
jgi:hypothetical protein